MIQLTTPISKATIGELKVGDEVTVTFYMSKDGSKRGNARGSVQLAGGRKIFAGDAIGGAESNR